MTRRAARPLPRPERLPSEPAAKAADDAGTTSAAAPSRGRTHRLTTAAQHSAQHPATSRPLSPAGRGTTPAVYDGKDRLRLWIRLLRASRTIEAELRERLKTSFATTLPRFDVMAALDRAPDGMLMSDLSRFLLVSNGNVTGIVDRLVADDLVARTTRNGDRRTSMVMLTPAGRAAFAAMALAHEGWIDSLLVDIDDADARRLSAMLKSFHSDWEMRG